MWSDFKRGLRAPFLKWVLHSIAGVACTIGSDTPSGFCKCSKTHLISHFKSVDHAKQQQNNEKRRKKKMKKTLVYSAKLCYIGKKIAWKESLHDTGSCSGNLRRRRKYIQKCYRFFFFNNHFAGMSTRTIFLKENEWFRFLCLQNKPKLSHATNK